MLANSSGVHPNARLRLPGDTDRGNAITMPAIAQDPALIQGQAADKPATLRRYFPVPMSVSRGRKSRAALASRWVRAP
jgi:hypothetical protein